METDSTHHDGSARHRAYSLGEEVAHSVTHGVGALLAVVGLTAMVVLSAGRHDPWRLGSSLAFGLALVLMYTFSTLYHSFPWPRVKHVFKVLDHAAIYLLIAGSYTPFTLVTLRAHGGWWLFGTVWALAVTGVALEAFWVYRPKWISALVYIAMGWLVVVRIDPLTTELAAAGVRLLVAGGLAYTLGAAFYVLKRVRYAHMVWHLFVLAGSVCHFLAVLLFVVLA